MTTLIELRQRLGGRSAASEDSGIDQALAVSLIDHEPSSAYNCGKSGQPSEAIMGSVSIRIDDELVAAARAAAKAEFRTVQGQLEFWAKVGRAALDNPDLPASFIAESLISMGESREDSAPFVPRNARQA